MFNFLLFIVCHHILFWYSCNTALCSIYWYFINIWHVAISGNETSTLTCKVFFYLIHNPKNAYMPRRLRRIVHSIESAWKLFKTTSFKSNCSLFWIDKEHNQISNMATSICFFLVCTFALFHIGDATNRKGKDSRSLVLFYLWTQQCMKHLPLWSICLSV